MTEIKIKYLEEHFTNYTVDVEVPRRRKYSPGTYGDKIATAYVVNFRQPAKKCRVYATCYSNVASHWVTRKGQRYHLQSWDFERTNQTSDHEREMERLTRALEAMAEASVS